MGRTCKPNGSERQLRTKPRGSGLAAETPVSHPGMHAHDRRIRATSNTGPALASERFTSQLGGRGGSIIRSNGRLASDRALRYVESIRWLAPTFCRRIAPAVS
jgi:hypothetical protein